MRISAVARRVKKFFSADRRGAKRELAQIEADPYTAALNLKASRRLQKKSLNTSITAANSLAQANRENAFLFRSREKLEAPEEGELRYSHAYLQKVRRQRDNALFDSKILFNDAKALHREAALRRLVALRQKKKAKK
jgi:hypothetical protein